MYKRLPYYLILSLAVLCIVSVPAALPQVKGAVVQSHEYDATNNIVTAYIVNTSGKNITAYNISIKETYADGHVNSHELMADTSGVLAVLQEIQGTADEDNFRKQSGEGLLHPGASRKEIIGVQPGLQNFEAVIDVVAYADQTAEATNDDGLQRLVSHRKGSLTSRQVANDIIKGALADPKDPDPAATAAQKILDRVAVWKAQKHTTIDFEPGEAEGIVNELKAMSSRQLTDKREVLTQYLAKSEKRIATLSPHAFLTKTGE